MLGCQADSVTASPLDGHTLPCHQHEHFQTQLCDIAVWVQTTLKWPSLILADKGHFGEWVKRRMNYQNKTKTKTNTIPHPGKESNHSHVHSNILVFHLQKETL